MLRNITLISVCELAVDQSYPREGISLYTWDSSTVWWWLPNCIPVLIFHETIHITHTHTDAHTQEYTHWWNLNKICTWINKHHSQAVNFLVLTIYSGHVRCYPWGELGNLSRNPLYYFATSCESCYFKILSSNSLRFFPWERWNPCFLPLILWRL